MTRFYSAYPRGFANEYAVYAVAPDQADDFAQAFPDAEPISRAEAIRLGWTRPRQAKRLGEQWFGGFVGAGSITYPATLAEVLDHCRDATACELSEVMV